MDIQRLLAHYHVDSDLSATVLDAIQQTKGSLSGLTADDLIAIDGFHIRGRKSTVELAKQLEITASDRVLDLGSGSGGTARYLATRFDCRVVGIDLTPSYVKLAAVLSELLEISGRTGFVCGNGLALPFKAERFDIVWSDHVQMNIADKNHFVKEMERVLKPGGKVAVHEVFSGPNGDPFLPVPWSSEAATSFMVHEAEMKQIFTDMGFSVLEWADVTDISDQWFQKMRTKRAAASPSAIGIHLLMGPTAEEKIANMGRSLSDGRARVIMGLLEKPQKRTRTRA